MYCDVCLVLEGTYPYVAGGVSTWVAQLLSGMPDLKFGILYLGPSRHSPRVLKYSLPTNVVGLEEVFLHDFPVKLPAQRRKSRLSSNDWDVIEKFIHHLMDGKAVDLLSLRETLMKLGGTRSIFQEIVYSRKSWDIACAIYEKSFPDDASFIDFFWTYRFINLPIMQLMVTPVLNADLYHSACTGYAGALAALFGKITESPLLISEHGIYTRERRIDIFDAEWISGGDNGAQTLDMSRRSNVYKEWWGNFFLSLSRTGYNNASQIYSLFSANRRDQIADGADARKVKIIPNGIELTELLNIRRRERTLKDKFVIGYVGRVAPIKDVKTLIRSLDLLRDSQVDFEAILMGPTDEDEEYAAECFELVASLGLSEQVKFPGRVNIKDYLGKLDVVVISSISEGLPFAILEAGCAGLPVVSTDVGACRELIEGRSEEDKALGRGGFVVPVANPTEMARSLQRLAEAPEMSRKMGLSSRERACKYYTLSDVIYQYRSEYELWLESSQINKTRS